MEIVDRYLKTLKSALPEAQREDIIKELSENIHSEIEDRETELGRPLNPAEIDAILRQHGHPLVVAARYRQDHRSLAFGRQLIGPTLFPFYAKVLTFNLGLTSVIILIIFTALMASGQSVGFRDAISTLFLQVVIQFSAVTLIFMAIDRHLTKFPDRWDPRKPIPAFSASHPALSASSQGPTVSRMESASQLIALTIFLAWLRAIQTSPFLVLGPAAAFMKAAPVWRQFYLPVVLVTAAAMLQSAINLFRPDWVRLRLFVRVANNVVGLAIFLFLVKAGTWVVPATNAGSPAPNYQHTIAIVNQSIFYSLLIAVVVTGVLLLKDLYHLITTRDTRLTKPSAAL